MFLGDFNLSQDLFLASSKPLAALEVITLLLFLKKQQNFKMRLLQIIGGALRNECP